MGFEVIEVFCFIIENVENIDFFRLVVFVSLGIFILGVIIIFVEI